MTVSDLSRPLRARADLFPLQPFTWAEFSKMHPFAPVDQAQGYKEMMEAS